MANLQNMQRAFALFPAALALVAATMAAAAPLRPWQVLQMPTAAEVQARWGGPPAEYGPEPYYGLGGAVSIEQVRRDLDRMKAMGFRAVAVQHGFGTPFAYMSPEHMAFFRRFVAEAKARDMRIWIVDDAGYPSGFAGGRISRETPDLRMQALAIVESVRIEGGAAVDRNVPEATVAATAVEDNSGARIDVPLRDRRLRWTAPAGRWTLHLVAHGFRTSPTRSDTNPNRVKDGSQSLIDYLDPRATAKYIAFTHEVYRQAVGDEFGKTILGFRGDEPDFSIRGLPWTPAFFARFKQTKGYDIRPYLAGSILAEGPIPGERPSTAPKRRLPEASDEARARLRADYYDVFSQLFAKGFFEPLAAWCAKNGLEYQIHLNHEEKPIELGRSQGDFFRVMKPLQVPGVDAIWHQIWTDTVSDFPRLAASVAHINGRPRAMTESFAAYRPAPDITMARYILNQQFVRGINLIEAMYFPASSGSPDRGPSSYMLDPAFPALAAYASRLSYLMSMGRPGASVALLMPRAAMWMDDEGAAEQFASAQRWLSERQIDYDVVDEDAIGHDLKAWPGAFETASGNRYRAVIAARPGFVDERVVSRLRAFAGGGGKVLFLGSGPSGVARRSYRAARALLAPDLDFATMVPGGFSKTPTPPAQPPAQPPPPLAVSPAFDAALETLVGPDALTLASPDRGLRYIHRELKDATVYLLFNESPVPLNNRVAFSHGTSAELWDPQTGGSRIVANAAQTSRGLEVPLAIEPYGTRIFVVGVRGSFLAGR